MVNAYLPFNRQGQPVQLQPGSARGGSNNPRDRPTLPPRTFDLATMGKPYSPRMTEGTTAMHTAASASGPPLPPSPCVCRA